jgi:hypothetical protein
MKFKELKLSAILLFGLGLTGLKAQESINAAGGNTTGSGGSASYSVGQVVYTTNTGTNGSVAQGVQQAYEIPTETTITQTIDFIPGWNIFSLNHTPDNIDMTAIFQSLIDDGSLIKIQDEAGNSLEDWGVFGGWQNYIDDMSLTEGYKIKISQNCELISEGYPTEHPFEIPLMSGWNIAGFPHEAEADGMAVMQQLIDDGVLLKVQDENGNAIEDWGIFGGWTNNIGTFKPGEGYKVKVNTGSVLTISESYLSASDLVAKVATITNSLTQTIHFITEFEGNGVDHMNINLVRLPQNLLQPGDEFAVFDGEICVGAVIVMPYNISNQTISIAASASDKKGDEGFIEGNKFILKLWKARQNREYNLDPDIVRGPATFDKHETILASLEKYSITGLEGLSGWDLAEVKCYPNPFGDEVTIEVTTVSESEVQIEVMNQLGQWVNTIAHKQILTIGVNSFIWDGRNANNERVAPGVYYLDIIVDGVNIHKKIISTK